MSKDKTKKDVKFSLKVMINKEKTKVLFAEADSHFADIMLSFLALPLGRIIKVLNKHYGDEAPTIGSLSSLYRGVANLDSSHFWTASAKQTLLNPRSFIEDEYERLKLDFIDVQPAENCTYCYLDGLASWSSYYSHPGRIRNICSGMCRKPNTYGADGVFTINKSSFIISDDLQIRPNETGLFGIMAILGNVGITDMDKAELIKVDLGFNEIMKLLKASLTSSTPLSDVILGKTRSGTIRSQPKISLHEIKAAETCNKSLSLKVTIQKSTGKVLYIQAKKNFIEFLFSFLNIPLGGVEHLLAGKTCFKAIDNLYRSIADYLDDEYFKNAFAKKRLMRPNVAHGCISENHFLPLTQEPSPSPSPSPAAYGSYRFPQGQGNYLKFPQGQGNYLRQPGTYEVTDDLTVTPFCIASIISSLSEQKIAISDVKEVEVQIGVKEALNILKASLTSTCALTTALSDALLSHNTPNKRIKREV